MTMKYVLNTQSAQKPVLMLTSLLSPCASISSHRNSSLRTRLESGARLSPPGRDPGSETLCLLAGSHSTGEHRDPALPARKTPWDLVRARKAGTALFPGAHIGDIGHAIQTYADSMYNIIAVALGIIISLWITHHQL